MTFTECRTCRWWGAPHQGQPVYRWRTCTCEAAPLHGHNIAGDECCSHHEDRPDPFEDEEVEDE